MPKLIDTDSKLSEAHAGDLNVREANAVGANAVSANAAKLIDANVILRYLLNDNAEMSSAAKEVIDSGAFTTAEVLAEVVYVLKGVYKVGRAEIAESIKAVLTEIDVEEAEVYRTALGLFAEKNLDFVDCILIARHRVLGDEVFSFDKKLNKNLDEVV